jgi:chemotaxis protein CheC
MSTIVSGLSEADVDRVREVTSIGAGHAANALAALVGEVCEMRVPQVRLLPPERITDPLLIDPSDGDGRHTIGIFFDVEGGYGGVVGLLFPASTCQRLIQILTGATPEESTLEMVESALREVGNILVSHVANAIAGTLGVAVLPSTPVLAMEHADEAFGALLATRSGTGPALRIETEISDRAHSVRGVMVFVPDHFDQPVPAPGF